MTLRFSWNGAEIEARPGDSIAAALTAAGVVTFGTSRTGRRRGLFCGMGICHECLVTVDGRRSERACMVEAADGMEVRAQADGEATPATVGPRDAERAPARGTVTELKIDLAIVGAGPAGLNAAIVAAEGGASVVVIDERSEPGGQYFKPRSEGYRGGAGPDRQHGRGAALRRRALASGATIRTGESVWFARRRADGPGFALRTEGDGGQARIAARAVIIATGAYERPAVVPGWTLPGVLTIGAAQTLVRRYGVVPGKQVLIAGHGPLGLQLAAEIQAIGGTVVAVAERARTGIGAAMLRAAWHAPGLVRDGMGYRLRLLAGRVPVLSGWELLRAEGDDSVTTAVLRRVGGNEERRIAADIICAGDGFAPQLELARLLGVPVDLDEVTGIAVPRRDGTGATSVDGVWIAGDAGGLGGAQIAEAQGRLAASGALEMLGRSGDVGDAPRQVAWARRFQSALWQVYAAPERVRAEGDTLICRCEEVAAAAVASAIAAGASDPGAVKRATRLGMGRCQARYCGAQVHRALAADDHPPPVESLFAPQVPARPIGVAGIAEEKPEWGGHRESSPAARPARVPTRPLETSRADLVIIGAGITGLAAALHAARSGADVICLDRGRINGEASGGNAGSLHLQLLSWDFGSKAVAGGSPQLLTLPLQQESIALWQDLEGEIGADFEMKITGGLMVAENTDQIAFLEAKTAAEGRVGIASEVIDAARIREIVPAISERIVAGAWCPGEGKINPLTATPAIARAAVAAGAAIEELTPVTGLDAEGDGYVVATPRGRIAAGRVLIAAGGWSPLIARHLGVELPIRGAPLQMVVTETAPPLAPCLIAHADRHLTMKQADAGTIIIGGAWTAVTGAGGQAEILPESLEGNVWVAAHTIPAIGGLKIIRSWAAMNIDIDGAPLIGPLPGHPRVVIAATANGYTLGPLMGREAAGIALGGEVPSALRPFTMDRFNSNTA